MDKSHTRFFTPIREVKVKEKPDRRREPKDKKHGWIKKTMIVDDIRGFSYPKEVLVKAS